MGRDRQFIIIESQTVHAHRGRPPADVLISQECDLYPATRRESARASRSPIGCNSAFARKHGFCIDVVTPEIANLPEGWEKRNIRLGFDRDGAAGLGWDENLLLVSLGGTVRARPGGYGGF